MSEEAVRAWVWGWSRCRDTPNPVTESDGFRITVDKPGHRVRFVLTGTESVRHRATSLTAPGTWLKVCAPRADVLPLLTPSWQVGEPEYLMTLDLAGTATAAPAGYSVSDVSERGHHDVIVHAADGSQAARGRFAVHERTATVDQVETDPAHRRRGLGRLVMDTISEIAAGQGARAAVLVSTVAGQHLYRSLGWRTVSEVTAAHLPEFGLPPA